MGRNFNIDWIELIPDELRSAAYKADSEWAWNREDALRVIDILAKSRYVILGVDIWLPTNPGPTIPTPFVYDWMLRAVAPLEEHAKSAKDFVRTFVWDTADAFHKDLNPYFNIVARPLES